jgi:non-heme chloroperoxidase
LTIHACQTIADYELERAERANGERLPPVLFVHGLWLAPNSWYRWVRHFEEAGYTALMPGWPDEPDARTAPNAKEALTDRPIREIADHYAKIIQKLDRKPVVIGHSIGGLIAEILAGRGLAAVTVAICPAPARGALPLPVSALKSAWPVVRNPANRNRAIPLTYDQFRYSFANAVSENEAKELYEAHVVHSCNPTLFESAAPGLDPWADATLENDQDRGPLLIVAGEKDRTVPAAAVRSAFEFARSNVNATEYLEIPGRGHSLTIDDGWQEVADAALEFAQCFSPRISSD